MKAHFILPCTVFALTAACASAATPLVPSTQDTSLFDGEYFLLSDSSFGTLTSRVAQAGDQSTRDALEFLLASQIDQYSNFTISQGVIRSGSSLVQEFSIIDATIQDNTLKGRAIWHEDVSDPGDEGEVWIELTLDGDILYFHFYETANDRGDPVILARMP